MTPTEQSDRYQDNFYLLTGKVIRKWVELELNLLLWLVDLFGIDELRARIVWDSYGDLRSKLNLLKVLTRNFADEGLWEEANGIFSDVEEIAQNRYVLPHAFGDVDDTESRMVFISDKVGSDFVINFIEEKSVDTDILNRWIKDIDESLGDVAAFKRKLGGAVHGDSLMHRRQ